MTDTIESLRAELAQAREERDALRGELESASKSRDALSAAFSGSLKAIDKHKARAERAEAERDTLRAYVHAIVEWLERNRPEVWRDGIWDAINAARAKETKA